MTDDPPDDRDAEERPDDRKPPESRDDEPEQDDEGADEADEDQGPRPISVRDLMPPASSETRRRAPERGEETGRPTRPPTPVEEEDEEAEEAAEAEAEEAPARPTPVRVAMDKPPPGDSRPTEDLPSRRFEVDGQEWIVRITGRTVTGTRPDPGALLMQLTFFRASQPETPARELLTVNRPLDALYDQDLEEFLDRSREAKQPFEDEARGR